MLITRDVVFLFIYLFIYLFIKTNTKGLEEPLTINDDDDDDDDLMRCTITHKLGSTLTFNIWHNITKTKWRN